MIADHLSRVEKNKVEEEEAELTENFLDEQLFKLSFQLPWYADIVNYLACGVVPPEFSYNRKESSKLTVGITSGMTHCYLKEVLT